MLLANHNACALAARTEDELVGTDWVDGAIVEAALAGGASAEHAVDGDRLVRWQLTPLVEGNRVIGTWATGNVREAPAADSVEARLRRALGVRRAAPALPADLRAAAPARWSPSRRCCAGRTRSAA